MNARSLAMSLIMIMPFFVIASEEWVECPPRSKGNSSRPNRNNRRKHSKSSNTNSFGALADKPKDDSTPLPSSPTPLKRSQPSQESEIDSASEGEQQPNPQSDEIFSSLMKSVQRAQKEHQAATEQGTAKQTALRVAIEQDAEATVLLDLAAKKLIQEQKSLTAQVTSERAKRQQLRQQLAALKTQRTLIQDSTDPLQAELNKITLRNTNESMAVLEAAIARSKTVTGEGYGVLGIDEPVTPQEDRASTTPAAVPTASKPTRSGWIF